MPKNILQDIVPPEKRSIRNIPVPQRKKIGQIEKQPVSIDAIKPASADYEPRHAEPVFEEHSHHEDNPMPLPKIPKPEIYSYGTYNNSGRSYFGSKKLLFVASIAALLLIGVGLASLFSGASITITPARAAIQLENKEYTATKGSQEGEMLGFEIVTLEKTAQTEVNATGEEKVERKASGTIVIYNDFDQNAQRLIKNTRFETPEGLIYRINESIVVPGKTTSGPGQVEVVVYADEPGEKYNVGKKDFTIPGFKGDPRYEKMYARGKTDMNGGFVGIEKKVSDNDKALARKKLQEELTSAAQKEISAQIPDSFVLFKDAFSITFKELPQTGSGGNSVTLTESATIVGILFDKQKLAGFLANQEGVSIGNDPVTIENSDEILFALNNKSQFGESTESITFALSGNIKLKSVIDSKEIATLVSGKSKKNLESLFGSTPSIEKAEATVRPFWKREFPNSPEEINVVIEQ